MNVSFFFIDKKVNKRMKNRESNDTENDSQWIYYRSEENKTSDGDKRLIELKFKYITESCIVR